MSEKLQQLGSLIPEVYYDLIGRLPAGTLLVLILLSTWRRPADLIQGWSLGQTSFLLLLLGAGWTAGLLLSPIAALIRLAYRKLVWLETRKELEQEHPGLSLLKEWVDHPEHLDRWLQDCLPEEMADAKVILPKMEAENVLCSYLAAALLYLPWLQLCLRLALVLYRIMLPTPPEIAALRAQLAFAAESFALLLFFLCPLLVLCFLAGFYRLRRLAQRQISFLNALALRREETADRGEIKQAHRKADLTSPQTQCLIVEPHLSLFLCERDPFSSLFPRIG